MKINHIGTFSLCFSDVDLYAAPNADGGSFNSSPEDGKLPRIIVGLDHAKWSDVMDILIHETIEYALTHASLRYANTNISRQDHASYLFAFDHSQFCLAISNASDFLTPAIPRLAVAFRKSKKHK